MHINDTNSIWNEQRQLSQFNQKKHKMLWKIWRFEFPNLSYYEFVEQFKKLPMDTKMMLKKQTDYWEEEMCRVRYEREKHKSEDLLDAVKQRQDGAYGYDWNLRKKSRNIEY